MTSKYKQLIFQQYHFDPNFNILELHYSLDDKLYFTETYRFDFDFVEHDKAQLDRAFQALFFMAGVSYYKTYVPPEIVISQGELDEDMAQFFSKTYQRGLGEFWYVNNLDPRTPVSFPANIKNIEPVSSTKNSGLLVALGGGKDSLVSVELLRGQLDVATWSLNHSAQLSPLVQKIGLPHYWVEREWDPQLFDLKEQDAYNGHIPISAIFAIVGTIVAILTGRKEVVTSNEQSANEPTLEYQGVAINHQYSKSQEFEKDYQKYLNHIFGDSIRYYSFLRPLGEVRIAEIFADSVFDKYKDVFCSCNRAFIYGSNKMSWDGTCPKCAFTFLVLFPFIEQEKLATLFGGKNLLQDKDLRPVYKQLLGIDGDKPLECVGEIKETRAAMRIAQQRFPELAHIYSFELPEDYDWRKLAGHNMPEEIYAVFQAALSEAKGT